MMTMAVVVLVGAGGVVVVIGVLLLLQTLAEVPSHQMTIAVQRHEGNAVALPGPHHHRRRHHHKMVARVVAVVVVVAAGRMLQPCHTSHGAP